MTISCSPLEVLLLFTTGFTLGFALSYIFGSVNTINQSLGSKEDEVSENEKEDKHNDK